MPLPFKDRWDEARRETDGWLDRLLPPAGLPPPVIHEAMRYSVFAGGKRLRAVLVAATAEALGCRHPERFVPGCAVELIHTYSLIHDDLPAMDDDDFRRGKPTSHKVYGEALAILAGDALLTYAFYLLARFPQGEEFAGLRTRLAAEVALAAGTPDGMVAGQVLDIAASAEAPDGGRLHDIHRLKTGAMIRGAVRCGALLGGAGAAGLAALTEYGAALGLAFQITDDLLDVTATREELGKTPGKDAAQAKLTFPAVYGLERSRAMARETVERALAALDEADTGLADAGFLRDLAVFVLDRKH
jgi:geranylgeranyl diphosphate synthase type II